MTFPLHDLKGVDLMKTLFFPIQCTNGKILSSDHGIEYQLGAIVKDFANL